MEVLINEEEIRQIRIEDAPRVSMRPPAFFDGLQLPSSLTTSWFT